MRRLATMLLALTAAAAGVALLLGAGADGSDTARFDVVFDDARGLIGGQEVKVAGAAAGKIVNVVVTPDYKARIEATVYSNFMPLRANARCTIRPEGLIAENYLECDPGEPPAPILGSEGGHPPTVPVTNTTEPVSLTDLFNIFNLSTRQRLMVLLDELGVGIAGRGQDVNDIIRRANPALALARRAIGILARQRAQLATIVDATNTVAAEASAHTPALQDFLTRAAAVTDTTAAHAQALSEAIHRLPVLLATAQPALAQLDSVALGATPLVAQLQASTPSLERVTADLGPFVTAAKPGLAKLRVALSTAIPTLHAVQPLVREIRSYTSRSRAKSKLSGRLFTSLQRAGFLENFLGIIYYVGAAVSRYDRTSHMLDISLQNVQNGACSAYATAPVTGCGANFGSAPASAAADRRAPRPASAHHSAQTLKQLADYLLR